MNHHLPALPRTSQVLPHIRPFVDGCAHRFATDSSHACPSRLQRSVGEALRQVPVAFTEEVIPPDAGGYSVDLLLEEGRVAVEVDGPAHFVHGPEGLTECGRTLMKRRQLAAFGYRVVPVPFWEWDSLRSESEKRAYLQQRGLGNDAVSESRSAPALQADTAADELWRASGP